MDSGIESDPEDITGPRTSKAIITESLNTHHQATRGLCLALPVSRLVSQTRLGRTTKVDRREDSGTGWPARGGGSSYVKPWPKTEASKGDMFFVSNIYTFLLGAKPIRDHYVAPGSYLRESVTRSLRYSLASLFTIGYFFPSW